MLILYGPSITIHQLFPFIAINYLHVLLTTRVTQNSRRMEENFVGGIACSLFFDSSSLNVLFPNRRSKKVSRGSHISFSFQLPTLSRSNFTSCHQMSPPTSTFSLVLAFIILSIRIKILPPLLLMSKDKRSYSRGLTRRGKMATFSLSLFSTSQNNHSARLQNKFLQRISGHCAPVHNEQPLIRRKLNSLFENGVQEK